MNNNVIKFTDPRKTHEEVREQACLWLARLDRGASAEELAQLAEWLEQDSLHVRMLINMAAMWDQAALLSELAEIFPLEDKAVALRARRKGRGGWFVAVTGLAAAMLVMGIYIGLRNSEMWPRAPLLDESFATAVGEHRQINLPDGSIVTLNTNTRAHFRFDGKSREVVLDHGEAFFTVAKDAARPFRVHAGSRVVEAVGTAFTVQHAGGQDIEVLVTEGKVNFRETATLPAVTAAAQSRTTQDAEIARDAVIPLVAGERLTIAQEIQQIQRDELQPEEVEVKLSWRMGMLVFQGDSLETVLEEVSRYTTVKLQADAAIRDIRIDGIFPAGDIDRLLIAMERNFNLDSQRIGDDEILLTARPPEE